MTNFILLFPLLQLPEKFIIVYFQKNLILFHYTSCLKIFTLYTKFENEIVMLNLQWVTSLFERTLTSTVTCGILI